MSSGEGEDEVDFCLKLCSKDELASVWLGKCVYVVEEIIHTEQVYVTDLENIVKVSIMWNNIVCVYMGVCVCTWVCVCMCGCCVCMCTCIVAQLQNLYNTVQRVIVARSKILRVSKNSSSRNFCYCKICEPVRCGIT